MIETGVYFENFHSFHDFGLILSEVFIPPAEPKTSYTDVPGRDGALDQTEAHGEVKYYDREGCKFTFSMNPSGDLSEGAFEEKKSQISNALNGKQMKITLDKDPEYYYFGRCRVDDYLSDKRIRKILVTARVQPYKLKQAETIKAFDLTAEAQEITLTNCRKSVCPYIECTGESKIEFGAAVFSLAAGTHKILDIRLTEGKNVLKISGTGTMTFRYQEGDL